MRNVNILPAPKFLFSSSFHQCNGCLILLLTRTKGFAVIPSAGLPGKAGIEIQKRAFCIILLDQVCMKVSLVLIVFFIFSDLFWIFQAIISSANKYMSFSFQIYFLFFHFFLFVQANIIRTTFTTNFGCVFLFFSPKFS